MSFRTRSIMAQHRLAIKDGQSHNFSTLVASTNSTLRRFHLKLPIVSKRDVAHAARMIAPALVAFTLASAAHAQGTMDFSGAQTLMGTFKTILRILKYAGGWHHGR